MYFLCIYLKMFIRERFRVVYDYVISVCRKYKRQACFRRGSRRETVLPKGGTNRQNRGWRPVRVACALPTPARLDAEGANYTGSGRGRISKFRNKGRNSHIMYHRVTSAPGSGKGEGEPAAGTHLALGET